MPFEFNDIEHAKKTMRVCHKVFEDNLDELDCGLSMICMIRPNVSEKARLWNLSKKAYYSTGHGCEGGIYIVTFRSKTEAEAFILRIRGKGQFKLKGISVGG